MNNATDFTQRNVISASEMIQIITTNVNLLGDNPEMAKTIPPVMFRGAPGVGKSAIVKGIADSLGIGFVDVRLAQLERVDICGLPKTENGVTTWCPPEFWPKDKNSRGIIFFDELTSAPAECQVAAYSIILDRRIPNSNYEIPNGWYIVAAGNRVEDRAVAKTMSSALANRFAHFELEADAESWIDWAVRHDINPSVTGYIQYRSMNLFNTKNQNLERGWPSPRSWERVSNIMNSYKDDTGLLQHMVFGLVGESVGTEFIAFNKVAEKFESAIRILEDEKYEYELPDATKQDQLYALCSSVTYLIWNNPDPTVCEKRVAGLFRLLDKLTSDFSVMTVKNVMRGNTKVSVAQAAKYLTKCPSFGNFVKKHNKAFQTSKKISL